MIIILREMKLREIRYIYSLIELITDVDYSRYVT
jgi:hypothetical protein